MEIAAFRAARGRRLVLTPGPNPKIIPAKLPFRERVVNFFKTGEDRYGTEEERAANEIFRSSFKAQLIKSEGSFIAKHALTSGLGTGWRKYKPLGDREIKLVHEHAQLYRKTLSDRTDQDMNKFIGATAKFSGNPKLIAAFRRTVKNHDNYAKQYWSDKDFETVADFAIARFRDTQLAAFREQHPGLSSLFPEMNWMSLAELGEQGVASPVVSNLVSPIPETLHLIVKEVFIEVLNNKNLLAKTSYEPVGWTSLGRELEAKHSKFVKLEEELGQQLGSSERLDLMSALRAEIAHQKSLVVAKKDFLEDLRINDPLSHKTVAYSNLLWAHTAGKIFDEAIAAYENRPALRVHFKNAKKEFIEEQTRKYNIASEDRDSSLLNSSHPATLGKAMAREYLRTRLKGPGLLGLDEAAINKLISDDNLRIARTQALNKNQTWAPISRDMVVNKNGVTRIYRSKITPANSINSSFSRRYTDDKQQRFGISSATKADVSHARNLKLSELVRVMPDQKTESRMKIIGHGVLDMWDIADNDARKMANESGAKEVLTAAFSVNDRIRLEALRRFRESKTKPTPTPAPVKITHVSVNLVTPAGWRELPGMANTRRLHDYQEKTYTFEQFRAFNANTGEQTFTIDDEKPDVGTLDLNGTQEVDVKVNVDVISFSFGINSLATGRLSFVTGGWDSVYEHNRDMMVRFVGDLGSGNLGSAGSRPGGAIGSVMDRLDKVINNPDIEKPAKAAHKALLDKIQWHADHVRSMFTAEDFKRGNGDPAKMGRHILGLQAYAEEALQLLDVRDLAFTMSKGCKSDKDRGGVMDVELKHQIITEDMGGEITPDVRLEADDQENYHVVGAASGQLENQMYNASLRGSKEGSRAEGSLIRRYLAGLAKFVSE